MAIYQLPKASVRIYMVHHGNASPPSRLVRFLAKPRHVQAPSCAENSRATNPHGVASPTRGEHVDRLLSPRGTFVRRNIYLGIWRPRLPWRPPVSLSNRSESSDSLSLSLSPLPLHASEMVCPAMTSPPTARQTGRWKLLVDRNC